MKISCDVIKDLLPLYVDDVLSLDSRELVVKHVDECESCRKMLEKLATGEIKTTAGTSCDDESSVYNSLKKIKKRMSKRQQLTSLITAVIILIASFSIWHYYDQYVMYLPYEKAMLTWENDGIYSKRLFRTMSYEISSDGKVMLLELGTTHSANRENLQESFEVWRGSDESLTYTNDEGDEVIAHIEQIYYMSEEASKQYNKDDQIVTKGIPTDKEELKKWNKEFERLKNKSKLIWSSDEGFIG